MRIAIATVAVPFQRGGADLLTDGLRAAIIEAGHAVDVVSLPFRFFRNRKSAVRWTCGRAKT